MPQEFQVLLCYSCSTFQVHQVKKATKWNCKLCGEKQSVKKVFGRGTGADCRRHVQKLNMRRGDLEWANQTEESDDDVTVASNDENCSLQSGAVCALPELSASDNISSKWATYTEGSVDADEEVDTANDMYTTSRVEFNQARKPLKRQGNDRPGKTFQAPGCKRRMSNKVSGFDDSGSSSALDQKASAFTSPCNVRDVQGSDVTEFGQSEERCTRTPNTAESRWNKHLLPGTKNVSNILTDIESAMTKTDQSVLPSRYYQPAATTQEQAVCDSRPSTFSVGHDAVSSKDSHVTCFVTSQKCSSDLSTNCKAEEKSSQLGSRWSKFIEPEVTPEALSDDDDEYDNVLFNNTGSQCGTLRNLDQNINDKKQVADKETDFKVTSVAFSVGGDDDLLREIDDF